MSGSSREGFAGVMAALGFQVEIADDKVTLSMPRRRGRRQPDRAPQRPRHDPLSPFAELAELELAR